MSGTSDAVEVAVDVLGDRAVRDAPLGALTTYRVGGPAAVMVDVETVEDLDAIARARSASSLPVLVVGRGSNLLVADSGFEGIAVCIGEGFTEISTDTASSPPSVTAGSGVLLPVLARTSVAAGLTGLEWAVGVPGSVGGAVRMNAGGHGSDVATNIEGATVFDLDTGEMTWLGRAELALRFRGSSIDETHVVVDARFLVEHGDVEAGESELREIVRWRRDNQPGGQNAGSVFVNPFDGEESAGRLIDELGLKGFRVGSAHVSEKHANFIQADPDGSADDVRELMITIAAKVEEAHGIALRSEIRLIGFDDAPGDAS